MMKFLKYMVVGAMLILSGNVFAQCTNTNLNAWDATNASNGGTLTVTSGGVAGTACKMTVTQGPNNNGVATVRDDMAAAEPRYRARFYVDATNLLNNSTGAQHRFKAFVASNFDHFVDPSIDTRARPALMQMFLVGLGGGAARLGGFCRDLNSGGNRARFGSGINPGNVTLQSGWNKIEVEIKVGAGTGYCRIWVNNNTESSPDWEQLNIDNNLMEGVKRANLGSIGATQAYATDLGTQQIHFDEFESRRQTFIGGPAN